MHGDERTLIITQRVMAKQDHRGWDDSPDLRRLLVPASPQNVELLRMRLSPSIVPPGDERDVYRVLNHFGRLGAAREWASLV